MTHSNLAGAFSLVSRSRGKTGPPRGVSLWHVTGGTSVGPTAGPGPHQDMEGAFAPFP